jgi:effector-binding domain-containing protein
VRVTADIPLGQPVAYDVRLQQAAVRHLAAVRDRRRWADLGPKLLALLDQVYVAVRAGRVVQTGRNVFVFRDRSGDEVTVEVGVEVSGPFAPSDGVIPVTTPAGEVASTVHSGPYSGLGAAHAAVIEWCAQHGRARADVWWEIYGDWHEDPARLETQVVYALAPQ